MGKHIPYLYLNSFLSLCAGEKPYKCNICQKSFGYNHVLKLHQVSHFGQKVKKLDFWQTKICLTLIFFLNRFTSAHCATRTFPRRKRWRATSDRTRIRTSKDQTAPLLPPPFPPLPPHQQREATRAGRTQGWPTIVPMRRKRTLSQ